MKLFVCFVTIGVFFLINSKVKAQIFQENEITIYDTINKPVIGILPAEIYVPLDDTTRFIVKEVSYINKGSGILYISFIDGSCGCSTAKILSNNIYPMGVGKIELSINLDGLSENGNEVLYEVYSNARNTPSSIKVIFFEPDKENGAEPSEKQSLK